MHHHALPKREEVYCKRTLHTSRRNQEKKKKGNFWLKAQLALTPGEKTEEEKEKNGTGDYTWPEKQKHLLNS